MHNTFKSAITATVFALAGLGGCGGGGSSSSSVPVTNLPAQGFWSGTTGNNRNIGISVLGDGTYYTIYTAINDPTTIDGFAQGTGTATASPGTFSSGNIKDFNFAGLGINSGSLSASYTSKQSFNGTVTYTGGTTTTFNTTYDASYETVPTLATLAGTYTGTSVVASGGGGAATIVISPTGALSSPDSCSITGTVTPRSDSNAYNFSMTFPASGCVAAVTSQTLTGLGVFDTATKQLLIFAPNASRTDAVFYVGVKP